MDDRKRMMFILEEDYYYVTLKIVSILIALDCDKKILKDYRKLSILLEIIKNKKNYNLIFNKILNEKEVKLNKIDTEKVIQIFCNSKFNEPKIKRVLFFLEKNDIIELIRDSKKPLINVRLKNKEVFKEIFKDGYLTDDIERCKNISKKIPRLNYLLLESLYKKIDEIEVLKWVI